MEVLAERHGAELLNQPGPHEQKALAALRRAFDHPWGEGETPLMADFLASLGNISTPELAAEQVRQLSLLHDMQQPGTLARLQIATSLATAYWNYARRDESIDLMESALAEYEQEVGPGLPQLADAAVNFYLQSLYGMERFARAELFSLDQLAKATEQQRIDYFTGRVFEARYQALKQGGTVSLGSGQTLFERLESLMTAKIVEVDSIGHR